MKRILKVMTLLLLSLLMACSPNEETEWKDFPESQEDYIEESGDYIEETDELEGNYKNIQVNIVKEDNSDFFASNTDSETLGDELERMMDNGDPYELKETNEGRILHAYEDVENAGEGKWKIFSDSCGEDQECPDDLDEIVLEDEAEFIIIYLNESDEIEIN